MPAPIKVEKQKPAPKPNGYIRNEDGTVIGTKHYTSAEMEAMDSATFKASVAQYEIDSAPKPQAKSKPGKPDTMRGLDPETGLPKDYTQRQIDSMSADEFRRVFIETQEGLKESDLVLCRKSW